MSNMLSVRRVKVQTLDEKGNPEGEPTFGVMAADDFEQSYNDTFQSFEELNAEIEGQGSLIRIVSDHHQKFSGAADVVGTDNFYGEFYDE